MEKSLQITHFCDHGHPDIQARAGWLREQGDDPQVLIHRTFKYVRDNFPYQFDLYNTRASQTLNRGYGVCWNKSILLIALLRANRIPAHFGTVAVHKMFCEPAIGKYYRLANHPYNHCLTFAQLDSRWVILDSVLDRQTYTQCYASRGVDWDIDWDGENDMRLYTEYLMGEPVMHEDLDRIVRKKAGNKELPPWMARKTARFVNSQILKKVMA